MRTSPKSMTRQEEDNEGEWNSVDGTLEKYIGKVHLESR
jgi:hypothetical protein